MIPVRQNWKTLRTFRLKRESRFRKCNICRKKFAPQFRYQLFCGKCRAVDDSFRFSEWLMPPSESLLAS